MFKYNLKLWMGVLLVFVLAAAFAYVALAQEQRLQNVAGKVSNIDILQLEMVDLISKVNQLSVAQANTTIPQTGANDLQPQGNTLKAATNPTAAKEPAVNPADIALAQHVLDTAGLHVMAATLSQTKTIDPAYLTTVTQVKKVLSATSWPASLAGQSKDFIALLDGFAAALQANNTDQAVNLVNNVHMAQHAFSKAIDDWLSSPAAQ